MRLIAGALGAVAVAVGFGRGATGVRTEPAINIGAAVAVSEPDAPALEPFIAADPTDPRRLLISASRAEREHGITLRAYLSTDGGLTWSTRELPGVEAAVSDNRLRQAVDTWISFDWNGIAYYGALAIVRSATPNGAASWGRGASAATDPWGRASVLVFRSDDHGNAFAPAGVIRARSFDAPKIAAGPAGEVIVVTTVSGTDSIARPTAGVAEQVAVYRSDDGARSFRAVAFLGPDALGHNPVSPVILGDSSVIVGWFDHPTFSGNGPDQSLHASRFLVARAPDGLRFGPPQVAADVLRPGLPAVPRLEADTWQASPFHGRLYLAWNGGDAQRADLSVSRSTDRGAHWSAPVRLSAAAGTAVFATVASAPDGTVGVMWAEHETDTANARCWKYYFAASLDGGESFGKPSVVTPDRVCPDTPANRAFTYPGWGQTDTVAVDWPHGGHYVGLTAGADGVFHPAWIDSRSGLFRVYTAPIRVNR